jgi:hypothetical protein
MKEKEDEMAEMLLQVTWYLMNPDGIPNELQCDWAKMVKKMREHTTFADVKNALSLPNSKSKAFNYFKRIDLKEFGKEQSHKSALETAKSTMEVEPSEDVMKNRLEQIMALLALKNYVKGSTTELTEKNIKAIADALPSKLVDMDIPLQEAFLPMKTFLKQMYDPVYALLEERIEPTESLMAILLILLHICNTIKIDEKAYGVYRINGVPPDGLKWVRNQLWDPYVDNKDKVEQHAKRMYHLSKLSLPIFINSDASLATIGVTIKNTPYFQFGIMGTNLDVKESLPDNLQVGDINKFFIKDTLFLFVSKIEGSTFASAYTGIPSNFYTIDYSSVKTKESTLNVTPYTALSIKKEITLDQLINIKHNLACNHSNLVLSIFFLLDSRLKAKKLDETAAKASALKPAKASALKPAKASASKPATTESNSTSSASHVADVLLGVGRVIAAVGELAT